MRRKDREIQDLDKIESTIRACKVCRLAMVDDDGRPYLVPLNFGYRRAGSQFTLFFHSATEGRKVDILRKNPRVWFEMDGGHALVKAESVCGYGYLYESVMGEGEVVFLKDTAEKAEALTCLFQHQTGRVVSFAEREIENVLVYRVRVLSISGKARRG